MNKKIGVVGGMGPMASQLFYKMVTEMTEAGEGSGSSEHGYSQRFFHAGQDKGDPLGR